jgi:hypothetical protein
MARGVTMHAMEPVVLLLRSVQGLDVLVGQLVEEDGRAPSFRDVRSPSRGLSVREGKKPLKPGLPTVLVHAVYVGDTLLAPWAEAEWVLGPTAERIQRQPLPTMGAASDLVTQTHFSGHGNIISGIV